MNHRVQVTGNEGAYTHLNGELLGHHGVVLQWVAYGHIAVKSHCCQEEAVCSFSNTEKIELCHTFIERNPSVHRKEVLQHLGSDGTGAAGIHESQVSQKDVHGCVKTAFHVDQDHQPEIPNHGDKVDDGENQEQ